MLGFSLGLPGIVLRASWSPSALSPAFRAGGFAPPPFSPAQLLISTTGFWAHIKGSQE